MYASKFDEPISEVILVGGSSLIKGIEGYLTDRLHIKTTLFNPFSSFGVRPEAKMMVQKTIPELVVATGAALKGIE